MVEKRNEAERAFLRTLGAGCSAPVGVLAALSGDTLTLHGRIVSLDGREVLEEKQSCSVSGDSGNSDEPASAVASDIAVAHSLGESVGRMLLEAGAERFVGINAVSPEQTDEDTLWGVKQ